MTTAKINEEQFFYCNQGLNREAVSLIVNGFAKVLQQLPMGLL